MAALGKHRGAVVMLDPTDRRGPGPRLDTDLRRLDDHATRPRRRPRSRRSRPIPPSRFCPRATLGRYVPGSVFKIVTAVAGPRVGRDHARHDVQAAAGGREERPPGRRLPRPDGHHPETGSTALDLVDATEVSCNIYYALTGLQTGGAALVDYAKRMGFGAPLPFDLPTAVSQVTNGDGKQPGGFTDDVELANAVVRPGRDVRHAAPDGARRLDRRQRRGADATAARHRDDRQAQRDADDRPDSRWAGSSRRRMPQSINAAMVQAVEGPLGRQFTTGAEVPGVTTAGKSGTAELGGTGEPHSWFIGFAPAENPKVAIAVLVEQAGRGGEVAAPIAGDLMQLYLDGLK